MATERSRTAPPPIIIVSGGVGSSGEQVVNTVLAQFPDADVPVDIFPHVREEADLREAVAQAKAEGGTIIHTLVETPLRHKMISLAKAEGVVAMDLMGPLIDHLTVVLGQVPLGRPGFYRHLHRSYFDRVAAIEYAMAHDDGRNRRDWPQADIVLIGVSRTGKTPLSMYLSVLGWKTANIPIVPEIPIPHDLYRIERSRVIGLTIDLDRVLAFRRQRRRLLGMPADSKYTQPGPVAEELELAYQVFRRGGFYVVDVTDKPVEASADEIMKRVGHTR